jgi:hypothetical protein
LKVENRESFTSLIPLRDDRPPDDGDIIITAVTLVLLCTDRLDLPTAAAGHRLPSRATLNAGALWHSFWNFLPGLSPLEGGDNSDSSAAGKAWKELVAEPTTAAVEATTAFGPMGASPTKTPATGARLSGHSTDGLDGLAST